MLAFALMLVAFGLLNDREPRPVTLTGIPNSQCELLASDDAALGQRHDLR